MEIDLQGSHVGSDGPGMTSNPGADQKAFSASVGVIGSEEHTLHGVKFRPPSPLQVDRSSAAPSPVSPLDLAALASPVVM